MMPNRFLGRLPAAMITPGLTIRMRTVLLVAVPLLLAGLLSYVWFHHQRVLGLDAYYYVEYTKELARGWPTVFGSNWPRGYPLVAAWITHLGPSPFMALVLVSFGSLAAIGVASVELLPRELRSSWTALAVFCAVFAVPAVPLLLGMPMSELPFAALLLLAVAFIRHWPARWAVWMSLFLGFGAFCVRYAGIFMLGLWVMVFIVYFETLRDAGRLRFFAGWYAFFAALTGFLLWTNIQATGHVSGADRGWGGGMAVIPEQVAHLGWALVGAFTSTSLKDLIGGVATPQGMLVGWIVMVGVGVICLRAIVNPKEAMARPLAMLVASYLGAFVMMRAMRHFPDINEPRYFVPVLFPLALVILLEIRRQSRKVLAAGAVAATLLGCALSMRGVSEATYGDVAFARAELDAQIRPEDVVTVNAGAVSLSAYYRNRIQWQPTCEEMPPLTSDYVVVVGRPTRRGSTTGVVEACGQRLLEQARAEGYVVSKRQGDAIVMAPALVSRGN